MKLDVCSTPLDSAKIEFVHLLGPKMADYLETIGMDSHDALAGTAAEVHCLAVKPWRSAVCRGLSELRLPTHSKTQREIASALGYARANLITMFKQGLTKVPIEKVPALAKILGLDSVHLLTFALREYQLEILKTIQANVGCVVTHNEYAVVEAIRGVTRDANPKFTKEQLSKIKAAISL